MKKIALLAIALFLIGFSVGCGQEEASPNKVMLIGVDGAEWDIIRPMVREGKLPNFGKLISEGASGPLESFTPMLSPVIWTSIATGKPMDQHGISWFMIRDPKTGELIPVSSYNRKVKAIWNMLSDRGRTSGVVGWWASWPPETVNGFIVSDHIAYHGFGVHHNPNDLSRDKTYPPELIDEISEMIMQPGQVQRGEVNRFMDTESSKFKFPETEGFEFANPVHHFMYIYSTLHSYEKLGTYLYKTKKPDFFAIYFEAVDTTGHFFMRYRPPKVETVPQDEYDAFKDVVEKVYMEQDRILGEFIALADENTTVVVVSDHGFKQGDERSEIVLETNEKGAQIWHNIDGVMILWGNGIKPGAVIEKASVMDVAPTILSILGEPVPQDMVGRVLRDAMSDDFARKNPVTQVATYEGENPVEIEAIPQNKQINEDIRDRLASLGYLSGGVPADIANAPATKAAPSDKKAWKEATEGRENFMNQFMFYITRGKNKEALALAEGELAKKPDDLELRAMRADTLRLLGDLTGATKSYKEMIPLISKESEETERSMSMAEVYGKLAEIELANNNFKEAHSHIEKGFSFTRANPLVHYALGEYHILRGEYEKALEPLHVAKRLSPQNIYIFNMLGECYLKKGAFDAAETNFKVALSINPGFSKSLYNLGVVYYKQNRLDTAKEYLEKALAHKGIFKDHLFYLGNIYFADGNLPQATYYYENAAKVEPKNWEIWINLARLAKFRKDKDKFQEYMKKAMELKPADMDAGEMLK